MVATPMKIADAIGVLVLRHVPRTWSTGSLSRPKANSSRVVAAWIARQQTKIARHTDARNVLVTQDGKCAWKM